MRHAGCCGRSNAARHGRHGDNFMLRHSRFPRWPRCWPPRGQRSGKYRRTPRLPSRVCITVYEPWPAAPVARSTPCGHLAGFGRAGIFTLRFEVDGGGGGRCGHDVSIGMLVDDSNIGRLGRRRVRYHDRVGGVSGQVDDVFDIWTVFLR